MALGEVRGWVDTRFVGVYELPADKSAEKSGATAASAPPAADVARQPGQPLATDSPEEETPERGAAVKPDEVRTFAKTCVTGVARRDTLRIRNGPGVRFAEVGGIPSGDCGIERLGTCRGAWCRVAWRGRVGWVNRNFLR